MKLLFFSPAIFWALITSILSLLPAKKIPYSGFIARYDLDQYGHAFIFMILSMLLVFGFVKSNFKPVLGMMTTLAIAVSYGIILELIQKTIPGRGFELMDIAFNSLGALVGVILAKFIFIRS